jgi:hypothetical protein
MMPPRGRTRSMGAVPGTPGRYDAGFRSFLLRRVPPVSPVAGTSYSSAALLSRRAPAPWVMRSSMMPSSTIASAAAMPLPNLSRW